MMNFLSMIWHYILVDGDEVVSPLYDGITLIGPYAIGVVFLLGAVWGIFLGAKYAKAEDPGEKENLHKVLVNFCIGLVVILTLISILYGIRGPLVAYIEG